MELMHNEEMRTLELQLENMKLKADLRNREDSFAARVLMAGITTLIQAQRVTGNMLSPDEIVNRAFDVAEKATARWIKKIST